MAQRVLIGDYSGRLVGEIEPDLGVVTWRLNQAASVKFTLSKKDIKTKEDLLRYGNRVLIQFDNGLPSWGGVIETPRTWNDATVEITAYSADQILKTRITDRGRYFSDASVGYIFEQVISEANQQEYTGILLGSIYYGGQTHSPEYHFERVSDIIQDSICQRLADVDYDIIGSLVNGIIVFTANLYSQRGVDRANVALLEGHNLAAIKLVEQGEIVNWWDCAGSGTGWGNDNRIYSRSQDDVSHGRYGLRQAAKITNDVTVQATLNAHADNLLLESKDPHTMLELEAVDLAPAEFGDYDVGDTVRVILYSYGFDGFDGMVRVEGREYDPAKGTCRLAVRTV